MYIYKLNRMEPTICGIHYSTATLRNCSSLRGANSDPGQFTGCSISKEQATVDVKDTNDMLDAHLGPNHDSTCPENIKNMAILWVHCCTWPTLVATKTSPSSPSSEVWHLRYSSDFGMRLDRKLKNPRSNWDGQLGSTDRHKLGWNPCSWFS